MTPMRRMLTKINNLSMENPLRDWLVEEITGLI